MCILVTPHYAVHPSVCNIHMMMSLVSQIFKYVSAVTYMQQQIHEYDNFVFQSVNYTFPLEMQGVVTYASPVEAFATGIKKESSVQRSFWSWSRDQDEFWATNVNNQHTFLDTTEAWQCFVLWTPVISSITNLGTERSSDQGRFSPIKILDRGRKCFYGRRVCNIYMYSMPKVMWTLFLTYLVPACSQSNC